MDKSYREYNFNLDKVKIILNILVTREKNRQLNLLRSPRKNLRNFSILKMILQETK